MFILLNFIKTVKGSKLIPSNVHWLEVLSTCSLTNVCGSVPTVQTTSSTQAMIAQKQWEEQEVVNILYML